MVDALIQAHRWNEVLKEPEITGFNTLAHKLSRDPRYLSRIHQLVYLAPDIQLAILEGRQPPDLTLDRLTKHIRMPLNFEEQRKLYEFEFASETCNP